MTLEVVQIVVVEVDGKVANVGKEIEEVGEAEEDAKFAIEVPVKTTKEIATQVVKILFDEAVKEETKKAHP